MLLFPIAVGVCIVIWGFWMLRNYAKVRARQEEVKEWNLAKGVMLGCEIHGKGKRDEDTGEYNQYVMEVKYSYEAKGESYEGTRIVFSDDPFSKRQVQAFTKNYPVGKPMKVAYNPEKHDECVILARHPARKENAQLVLGLVLIVMGLISAVFSGFFYAA